MDQGNVDQIGTIDLNISGQTQGDVLYFNGSNWVRLAPGTADQSLRTGGAGANPAWETVDNATDLSIASQTTGDMLYYNGANWVRLAPGTSGQTITSNGAGVAPTYQDASGASNIYLYHASYHSNLPIGQYYGQFNSSDFGIMGSGYSNSGGIYCPVAGTLTNFRVRFGTGAPSLGTTYRVYSNTTSVYTVIKTNANATSWTTATGTYSVSAGNRLYFYGDHSASSPGTTYIQVALTIEPS